MKYRSKNGTVINIPDGASPGQIAQIKARADQGYGIDAQKIADGLGKAKNGGGTGDKGGKGGKGGKKDPVDPGVKGAGAAYEAANAYVESLIANMKPLDLSDAPKLLADGDIQKERQGVYDSNYKLQTQGVEQNRAHDLEQQKQDLANRGIPYDPGTNPDDPNNVNNVYARSLNNVNQRYDTINSNAAAAANAAADSSMTSFVNANKTQNDQYVQNKSAEFQSQLDSLSGAGSIINALMQKYGIDAGTAKSILDSKTATRIAQINNQRSGRGGGGGFGVGFGGTVT